MTVFRSACYCAFLAICCDRAQGVDCLPSVAGFAGRPVLHAPVVELCKGGSENATSDRDQKVVWISAFARSGSSTLYEMVKVASSEDFKVFSLFEPSHNDAAILSGTSERDYFDKLFNCDFSAVTELWDGPNEAGVTWSTTVGSLNCSDADMFVVKTVNYGHDLRMEALPRLRRDPRLLTLNIFRDPRGVYGSQKQTIGDFNQANEGISGMQSICDTYAANLRVEHEQLHSVVFEHMTTNPTRTLQDVYEFLDLPIGPEQTQWIDNNFDATCAGNWWKRPINFFYRLIGLKPPQGSYSTCKEDSTSSNEKWRYELLDTELQAFELHPTCRQVATALGYPLGVTTQAHDNINLIRCILVLTCVILLVCCSMCCYRQKSKPPIPAPEGD